MWVRVNGGDRLFHGAAPAAVREGDVIALGVGTSDSVEEDYPPLFFSICREPSGAPRVWEPEGGTPSDATSRGVSAVAAPLLLTVQTCLVFNTTELLLDAAARWQAYHSTLTHNTSVTACCMCV